MPMSGGPGTDPNAARSRPSSVPITATRLSAPRSATVKSAVRKPVRSISPIVPANRAGGIVQWPQQRDLPLLCKRPGSSPANMEMARIARITARLLERPGGGDVVIDDAIPARLHDNAARIGAENVGCWRNQHGTPLPFGHAEPRRVVSPLIRQNAQGLIDSGKLLVQFAGKQNRSILGEYPARCSAALRSPPITQTVSTQISTSNTTAPIRIAVCPTRSRKLVRSPIEVRDEGRGRSTLVRPPAGCYGAGVVTPAPVLTTCADIRQGCVGVPCPGGAPMRMSHPISGRPKVPAFAA